MQIFYYNINFVFLTYKICGKIRNQHQKRQNKLTYEISNKIRK